MYIIRVQCHKLGSHRFFCAHTYTYTFISNVKIRQYLALIQTAAKEYIFKKKIDRNYEILVEPILSAIHYYMNTIYIYSCVRSRHHHINEICICIEAVVAIKYAHSFSLQPLWRKLTFPSSSETSIPAVSVLSLSSGTNSMNVHFGWHHQ